jgi:SAM-dependent methyltransferase
MPTTPRLVSVLLRPWDRYVLPRVIDKACAMDELEPLRAQAASGLHGRVVEIGFGSGLTLRHLPQAVDSMVAVEPSATARALAAPRITTWGKPLEWADDAHRLSLPDASVDAVISTMTLCTVSDPAAVLAQCRRVLKPGGTLHVLEHGRSTDPAIARRQDRINNIRAPFVGGCNVNRDLEAAVIDAGFEFEAFERRSVGSLKAFVAVVIGRARVVASS